jgi:hypothetical protein
MAPKPRRVAARPLPEMWSDSEVMTLEEAAALLFPDGLITTSTLRSAYKQSKLEVIVIARKVLVNKALVAQMTENARRTGPPAKNADGGSEDDASDSKRRSGAKAGK